MEPMTIGVLVATLLAKTLDRAETGLIDGAMQVAQKALETLRKRFRGDSEATKALEALAQTPDSKRREKALADLLEARAAHSPELLDELKTIVNEAETAGMTIGSIEQIIEGDGNVQIGGAQDSHIIIKTDISPEAEG